MINRRGPLFKRLSSASAAGCADTKAVMAASSSSHVFVDLAFAEEPVSSWSLNSAHFPSKIGGKPSWLSMKDLPKDIKCKTCNKEMIFMLQVYSPRESESTFHRSLFLFVCNNESCVDNQSRVFRCQLPRENQFYSSESPSEDPENPTIVTPERFGLKTCAFCGGSGHLSCAKCNKVFYCSKDHQVVHWKFLGHKESCEKGDEAGQETEEKIKSMLLPEYELTIDLEENYANQSKKSKSESNDKDYQEALKKIKPSLQNEDLESVATESQEDKCFSKFRSVVSECPEHVLRYARTECLGPLWATDVNQIKTSDVPNCAQFKGDFATIVVYTCKNSCSNGPEYREEYVWKQMFQ